MKKKQVVALLLTAAMTTASFLPSTGFFDITEVQAETVTLGENDNVIGVEGASVSELDVSGNNVTVDGSEVKALSGSTVTFTATVTGSGLNLTTLVASLGGYQFVTGEASDKLGVPQVTTSGATSDGSVAVISGSATYSGYGTYKAKFVSGDSIDDNGFGETTVKVLVDKSDVEINDSDSSLVQKNGNNVTVVTKNALKLTNSNEDTFVPDDYVSGGSLHVQWFKNKSLGQKFDKSDVLSLRNGWTSASAINTYTVNTTSDAAYAVAVWFGDSDEPTAEEQYIYIAKVSDIEQATALDGGITVDGDLVKLNTLKYKNGYKKDTEVSGAKYEWYEVDKSVTIKEEEQGTTQAALKIQNAVQNSKAKAIGTSNAALDRTLWSGSKNIVAIVTESAFNLTVAFGPKEVTGVVHAKTISASGMGYNQSENTLFVNDVDNNLRYLGGKGETATDRTAKDTYFEWYLVDANTVDNLDSTSAAAIRANTNNKLIAEGTYASRSAIGIEKTWVNKNVVVIISDAEDHKNKTEKFTPIKFGKKNVSYKKSQGDSTNSGSRRGTTPAGGTAGGNTSGTNGTTGNNTSGSNGTTGTNTSGTSTTTTPTGTTPTSNTVTNPDGSKTTTTSETKADGTKVETTKTEYPDGSTLEVTKETKPDGTTIETTVETAVNGDKATTVYTVSPNGTKSKKVSIVKADGTSETTTITENKDGSATIVNETKDASGTTSMAYSLAAGASGVTVDKIDTTAKKVVIPAKIAIAGGAATLKGVTSLKANTLTLEGKTIKVTKVGAAALKGNKTATNLVVGKNIKTIGKQAFMNASKVKTVNIKGNVNTVGKNSFKNINKKATIKIKTTAKQFKALKKKIKNKGAAPAKVTYKRVK